MADMNLSKNVAAIKGKKFMPKVANALFMVKEVPAFTATANTESQVNIQTTQEQIKAGQNNVVIGTLVSERTVDISFSTPEWKIEFLAANIGETIQVGKFSFYVMDGTFAAKDGVITLTDIPSNEKIYVEIGDSYVAVEAKETTIDLTAYGITGDECVSAIYMKDGDGKRVNISASTDPLVGKLVLESPIFEGTKGRVGTSQYVFPAFALSGNWDHQYGSNASYTISGTAVATNSEVCGEGQSYGYYQETIDDEDVNSFSMIVAAPSVIELEVGETETITVYGTKGALYSKTEVSGATFATKDTSVFTVDASSGKVTAVSAGSGIVTITYNDMVTTVAVEVVATGD